jgi:hypothetical protein
MNTEVVPTVDISIYMAGDIDTVRATCREFCFNQGFCVTVTESEFIYTGGSEAGVRVGVVNYPRFPSNEADLMIKAKDLALTMIESCFQLTALVVGPSETVWLSRRES